MDILNQLPPPPRDKIGYPWTVATPPQYIAENLPKISIITPSFNQGQFIEETIRSVLLQGYPNLEYIVIDGGSTDETIEIIQKYSDFITYWVSEKDNGQSDAINKGLKQATGEVFNWLNSDDFYLPNALLTVGKAFKNEQLNVFCAQQFVETSDGKRSHFKGVTCSTTIEASLASRYFSQTPTFFRLSIVRALGGVATELYFCMDLELWVNYLAHYGHTGIEMSAEFLDVFRLHNEAKTYKSNNIRYSDHINLFLCLIDSGNRKISFPKNFQKDNVLFNQYFRKSYPLNQINQKRLDAYIAENLLEYYCQFLNWQSVFSLYFYALRMQPFQHLSKRFYFLPILKIKRYFFIK